MEMCQFCIQKYPYRRFILLRSARLTHTIPVGTKVESYIYPYRPNILIENILITRLYCSSGYYK
jgi:hypothetical protein